MTHHSLAPVALFVYNRPEYTLLTLQALAANTLATDTDVYVFADGASNAQQATAVKRTREVVASFGKEALEKRWFKSFTLIERKENFYLERNIIEGIAQVFEHHENIIVLEDDICTSRHFLAYMNKAFALYRDETRVMHISGFTRLDLCTEHPELVSPESETYFTSHTAGWGWGTWRDRWQKHFRHFTNREEALRGLHSEQLQQLTYNGAFPCLQQLDRSPIPWDICWELAVLRADGLALSPAQTLIRNIGLQQGTHFGRSFRLLQYYNYDRPARQTPLNMARMPIAKTPAIEALFAEAIRDWGIRYTALGKIVRRIYRWLKA